MAQTDRPISKFARVVESPVFWVVFVVIMFAIPLARSLTRPALPVLPVLGTLPSFTLTNQDNEKVTDQRLRGSVLVVNFIFTSCPQTCPLLTEQMKKIQDRVRSADQNIRLLSISVDPATDTPAVLKAFAGKYRASFGQWWFLTGDLAEITRVVVQGFKVPMDRVSGAAPAGAASSGAAPAGAAKSDTESLMEITHGEHFVIVDQAGQIRDYARANNTEQIDAIVRKVAVLMNTKPPL